MSERYLDLEREPEERLEDLLQRLEGDAALRELSVQRASADDADAGVIDARGALPIAPADSAALTPPFVVVDLDDACDLELPAPLNLAATFAPADVRGLARGLRDALRRAGAHWVLVDGFEISRGDGAATSGGEDPYLAGRIAVALVRGLPGERARDGVGVIARGFIGAGFVADRLGSVSMGERELREICAEPFAAAIRDGELAGVMTVAAAVDGLPCSASPALVRGLLRDDLGFDGLVFSAADALEGLVDAHGVADSPAAAARVALRAGVDLEWPESRCLAALAEAGAAQDALAESLRRVASAKLRRGLLDPPDAEPAADVSLDAAARRLAALSCVLLTNDGELPLSRAQRVAVHAPDALETEAAALRRAVETPLDGRTPRLAVVLVDSAGLAPDFDADSPFVLVVFGWLTPELGPLVERAAATLLAGRPGGEGGAALADLLFGAQVPSGRLPMSIARPDARAPAHYNRRSGPVEPWFPFGHGLSYARFDYRDLQCPESVDTRGVLRISFRLRNDGDVEADEVVQIYAHDCLARVARPQRQLIGFARVAVAPGTSVECAFRIDPSQFAYCDEALASQDGDAKALLVEPGDVELLIGGSSQDTPLHARLRLTGEERRISQRQIVATQLTGVEPC
ncbi:MAG: glycoside hydrolase family 3 N-terminal domain-containing protein [Pseudomonadota bacterium]